MFTLLVAAAALFPAAPSAQPHMVAAMVVSTQQPRPGSTILLGFSMRPQPGWHGYWSNPGENGLAPSVSWKGSAAGLHFGPLEHPAPSLMRLMGLVSFVHAREHVLISRVSVDRRTSRGAALPIRADLTWAACSDSLCVPQHSIFTMTLIAGDGSASAQAPLLRSAAARIPAPAAPGTMMRDRRQLILQMPKGLRLDASRINFFPETNGVIDASAIRVVGQSPLKIAAPLVGTVPNRLSGVVSDGQQAFHLRFQTAQANTLQPLAHIEAKPETGSEAAKPARATEPTKTVADPARREGSRSKIWQLFTLLCVAVLCAAAVRLARRRLR